MAYANLSINQSSKLRSPLRIRPEHYDAAVQAEFDAHICFPWITLLTRYFQVVVFRGHLEQFSNRLSTGWRFHNWFSQWIPVSYLYAIVEAPAFRDVLLTRHTKLKAQSSYFWTRRTCVELPGEGSSMLNVLQTPVTSGANKRDQQRHLEPHWRRCRFSSTWTSLNIQVR